MPKRVLSVGQCQPDHTAISRFLNNRFDVEIEATDLEADTLERLRKEHFDLVLINRKLDRDYSDGLAILKTIKADTGLSDVPIMLVSNYPEAHEEAVAAGGEPGFGKLEYDTPEAVARLAKFLG